MRNKGIIQSIKESDINNSAKLEITIDDIRQFKKELEEYLPKNRQSEIFKYCPHRKDLIRINLPMQEGDCEICFKETFGNIK